MGGDHGPSVTVAGVETFLKAQGPQRARFILHGDEAAIKARLEELRRRKSAGKDGGGVGEGN